MDAVATSSSNPRPRRPMGAQGPPPLHYPVATPDNQQPPLGCRGVDFNAASQLAAEAAGIVLRALPSGAPARWENIESPEESLESAGGSSLCWSF